MAIAGLAPNVRILMYKVWNIASQFSLTPIINALRAIIATKRVNPNYSIVLSASFTTTENNTDMKTAIKTLDSLNVMQVYPTGNNADTMRYPAKYSGIYNGVISVGGSNRDDGLYPYTNYAHNGTTDLVLIAPAQDVITTGGTGVNSYTTVTGTSIAAPLVGGTIAMMFSVRPLMNVLQVRNKLIRGCDKPAGMAGQNYTTHFGYGRLNSFNCVALCLDSITGTIGTINTPVTINSHKRIYGNTNVVTGSVVTIGSAKTFVLDKFAHLCFENFGKIKIPSGSSFIQRRLSTVCDRGEIVLETGGCYLVEDSAIFFLTGQGPGGPNDYGCIAVWGGSIVIENNSTLNINQGGFMTVRNDGKLILEQGAKLKFGGTSYLELSAGANLKFGSNSSISFSNQSYLYADTEDTSHIYFSGITDTTRWDGIFFDSSLTNDTLEKCVFTGAKTAITIRNNTTSSNVTRIFEDNIFNVPSGEGNTAIDGENTHKITIEDNIFNMPVTSPGGSINVGVFLKNVNPSSGPVNAEPVGNEDNADNQMVYILNIIDNTFNKGSASIVLANYTSSFPPYYIKGNYFDAASTLNILGLKITGTIKDNVTSSMFTPMGIHLINSNPDLYNNTIAARDVPLHLSGASYPNLAPVISGNQMIWRGGKNHLNSNLIDAVQLETPGNVFTDYGNNRFLAANSGYHIFGWIDSTVNIYYTRNNCWYRPCSTVANINLTHINTLQQIPVISYNYVYDCSTEPNPIEYEIDYMGHGISDSILISGNITGEQPAEDEQVYIQALDYFNDNSFTNAIINYKNLIDNYPSSTLIKDALYNIYSCHEALDTSANQDYINTLYGNLNIYLGQKIQSDSYDNGFNDIAYDVKLMCEAKLGHYNDALNGYEFLSLFHPDPNIRLTASWNYAEIQAILNIGNGGGNKGSEMEIEDFLESEISKVEDVMNSDPTMQKMKKSFEILTKQRSDLLKAQLNTSSENIDEFKNNLRTVNDLDKFKEDKAKMNLFELRNLNNEEFAKRRVEILFLTTRNIRNEINKHGNDIAPNEFKLYQNYPNPFNPNTTINYQLPVNGFVRIKIFDIAGRELLTLVNELKTAGSYNVVFDGQNFASGIYFYKIEAGNFTETKRMVLIK